MRNVLSFFDSYEQNYKLRFLNEVHSCGNLIESFLLLSSWGFHSFHFWICNKMVSDFLLDHCPSQCVWIIFGIIMLGEWIFGSALILFIIILWLVHLTSLLPFTFIQIQLSKIIAISLPGMFAKMFRWAENIYRGSLIVRHDLLSDFTANLFSLQFRLQWTQTQSGGEDGGERGNREQWDPTR